ncbi:trehalose-phosphatase [Microbacterium pseudoresistens]|uniref:Trehalose 6-phosphate phosphatase n=1 Tax=Microbacterium pseudoresistens TaxID=640634 RepID=A0A7Y9EWM7_9MICO|nr:trehalose-phosphatase [Microbacterium pseudoresistens]NYD55171.1 trehalose 6-phosphate phosphatase [Microbacterium pseudoresistens]
MAIDWTPGTADPALRALAATARLVVALDFDGTVSVHVDDPMSARALPGIADAVAALAALPDTQVAFVSGRSMNDLQVISEHTDDSPVILVGSHGAQYWFPGEGEDDGEGEPPADAAEIAAEVRAVFAPYAGVEYEPKTYGFGVHGRMAAPADEERAFADVDAWAARRIPAWRRRNGKHILEFSWRAEGKDAAIARLRERFAATAVFFAGDDVTDEDALAALAPQDLGVRVGGGQTAATLRVDGPQQMPALLVALARERRAAQE